MKKSILLITSILVLGLYSTSQAYAVDCFTSFDGDQTVSATCTLKTYIDGNDLSRLVSGVDSGTSGTNTASITVSAGTMTINSNETLVANLSLTGGSIAIAEGAIIDLDSPLWMVDADADGYPIDTKVYIQTTAPTDGVRLNTMTDIATADCDDGSYNASNSCCVIDTYYADNDGDGYGAGAGASMCPTTGYVTDNTDCYDSNSSAKPGSTACSGGHRGDGSFDYNCSGAATTCSGYDLVGASSGTAWARTGCGTVVYVNTAPTSKVGCGNNGYAYVNASVSTTSQVNCQNSISLVTKKKRIGTQQRQCQ